MADNIDVKDAAGLTATMRGTDNAGVLTPHHIIATTLGAALIGQQTKAASLPFVPPSDWALLGSGLVNPSDNFVRPADTNPYQLGELIADNTVAASVTSLTFASATRFAAGAGRICRARIFKSTASLTLAQFRLHLYSAAPTLANGDNAAWLTSGGSYLGAMDCTMDRAFSDGAYGEGVPHNNIPINFKLASGTTLRGLLEARAAYAPGNAETFTVTLEIEQT